MKIKHLLKKIAMKTTTEAAIGDSTINIDQIVEYKPTATANRNLWDKFSGSK